jgi:hypothetical protein
MSQDIELMKPIFSQKSLAYRILIAYPEKAILRRSSLGEAVLISSGCYC